LEKTLYLSNTYDAKNIEISQVWFILPPCRHNRGSAHSEPALSDPGEVPLGAASKDEKLAMYKLAFVAAAAAMAFAPSLAPTPAQAGTRVVVSPVYVPAVYCSYKSKDWVQKGIVSCPTGWQPIGEPGAKWQVSKRLTLVWNTYGAAGKDYTGYWAPRR